MMKSWAEKIEKRKIQLPLSTRERVQVLEIISRKILDYRKSEFATRCELRHVENIYVTDSNRT